MSQDWTRNDVLENSARAVLLINECLANAVEMRIKASQQKAENEQLKAKVALLEHEADCHWCAICSPGDWTRSQCPECKQLQEAVEATEAAKGEPDAPNAR